jgi:hypothetical protein
MKNIDECLHDMDCSYSHGVMVWVIQYVSVLFLSSY